jgi:GDPmannose 4,6-dehydratase
MPTALILGVASQDGSYLAELLLSKGYQVIGTTRNVTETNQISFLKDRIILQPADLLDFASISALVQKYHPDEYYNLAALTVPSDSWNQSYLVGQITGLGPVHGLEAIREFSPRSKFFQATSREIFGSPTGTITEKSAIHPENPYSCAKAYAHHMVDCYRKLGIFACSGILFNHESPRRQTNFVSRKITSAAAAFKTGARTEKLVLRDLNSKRDWGYAADYVEAMWQMLQNKIPTDYIVSSGQLHSVRDICEIAFSFVGLDWQKYIVEDKSASIGPETAGTIGDHSLITHDLGWSPKTSFKELIELMVQSDLSNS